MAKVRKAESQARKQTVKRPKVSKTAVDVIEAYIQYRTSPDGVGRDHFDKAFKGVSRAEGERALRLLQITPMKGGMAKQLNSVAFHEGIFHSKMIHFDAHIEGGIGVQAAIQKNLALRAEEFRKLREAAVVPGDKRAASNAPRGFANEKILNAALESQGKARKQTVKTPKASKTDAAAKIKAPLADTALVSDYAEKLKKSLGENEFKGVFETIEKDTRMTRESVIELARKLDSSPRNSDTRFAAFKKIAARHNNLAEFKGVTSKGWPPAQNITRVGPSRTPRGFANEKILNAALEAQGKAAAGKAKPRAAGGRIAGALGFVAAPIVAAAIAYDSTKNQAMAEGADGARATANAAGAALVAGGTTAAVIGGIAGTVSLAAKAAPIAGRILARALPYVAVAAAGYEAYEGFKRDGAAGAAEGLADFATFGGYSYVKGRVNEPAGAPQGKAYISEAAAKKAATPAAAPRPMMLAGNGPVARPDGQTEGYTRTGRGGLVVRVKPYATPIRK